jgi:hypothetical protein
MLKILFRWLASRFKGLIDVSKLVDWIEILASGAERGEERRVDMAALGLIRRLPVAFNGQNV